MYSNNISYPYYYPEPLTVNGKSVHVVINRTDIDPTPCGEKFTYQILSIAATDDGGGTAAIDSSTTVEAYITETIEYQRSSIMDHIITINEELTAEEIDDLEKEIGKVTLACHEGCAENCTDLCGTVYDYNAIPDGCYGCGAVYNYPDAFWPTAEILAAWYGDDVKNKTHYFGDTEIDLKGNSCPPGPIYVNDEENNSWPSGLGPLYVDGELEIENSSNPPATLTLTGTLYITGDTIIAPNHDLTLDLNGHAIFIESSSADALIVGGGCTISGPGAIIAVGDIHFAPKSSVGTSEEPVFIFSISGTSELWPSGDLYGAVAGNFYVEVKSGTTPTLTYPPGGFGDDFDFFPSMFEVDRTYDIASWEINPL
jgi:hypothetical protein